MFVQKNSLADDLQMLIPVSFSLLWKVVSLAIMPHLLFYIAKCTDDEIIRMSIYYKKSLYIIDVSFYKLVISIVNIFVTIHISSIGYNNPLSFLHSEMSFFCSVFPWGGKINVQFIGVKVLKWCYFYLY